MLLFYIVPMDVQNRRDTVGFLQRARCKVLGTPGAEPATTRKNYKRWRFSPKFWKEHGTAPMIVIIITYAMALGIIIVGGMFLSIFGSI